MARTVGPSFDCNDITRLADGTVIYGVWANGKAPLNGGGGRHPSGRYVGRVWQTEGYGWVAAAPSMTGGDSWSEEVGRSVRYFRTRKDACLFLYGHAYALGAIKFAEAMAAMPRAMGGTK